MSQESRLDRMVQGLLGLFVTKPDQQLLSFDEVQRVLQARNEIYRGTRRIPLDAVVGSVGRYRDFNRFFLPLHPATQERWNRVNEAEEPLPPIEVYQIGEVYFVRDGNHRVSVARNRGATDIEARVTEVPTRVPITPDMNLEEVIGQAQAHRFQEETDLARSRPQQSIALSQPDRYETLLDHIEVHRYYLGHELQRDVLLAEAAASWYDTVYTPVVEAIHQTGALREFPQRSEADLYLWVAYHREKLKERYGEMPSDRDVASALAGRFSDRPLINLVKTVTRAISAAFEAATESPEPPGATP